MAINNDSRGAKVARIMASMGFQPKPDIDARYVEYYKDYAEPHGRLARCAILFNKGGVVMDMDHAMLERFVVTVQGVVDPVIEEITAKAPRVMHDDMLCALRTLEGVTAAQGNTVICGVCRSYTSEFALGRSGTVTCIKCLKVTIGNKED